MGCVRTPQLGYVFNFAASTRFSRASGWRGIPVSHPADGIIDGGVGLGKRIGRGQGLIVIAVKQTAGFDTGATSTTSAASAAGAGRS